MNELRHIIKSQILEVEVDEQMDIESLQKEVSQLFYQHLLPVISRVLDDLSPAGVIHRIDFLEIDLGTFGQDFLKNEMPEKLEAQMYTLIAERLKNQWHSQEIFGMETQPTHSGANMELLVYFVQTGLLPWWADEKDSQALDKAAEQWAKTQTESFKTYLTKWIQSSEVLQRMITQFSDERLFQWVKVYTKETIYLKLPLILRSELASELGESVSRFRFLIWKVIFEQLDHGVATPVKLLQTLLQTIAAKTGQSLASINGVLYDLGKSDAIPPFKRVAAWVGLLSQVSEIDTQYEEIIQTATKHISGSNGAVPPDLIQALQEVESETKISFSQKEEKKMEGNDMNEIFKNSGHQLTKTPQTSELYPGKLKRHDSFSETESIYLNNAGLVVLWFFLAPFFEKLDWLHEVNKQKQFTNTLAQQRAVRMLQYLVDGSTSAPEYKLPLNKLLCGLPIVQPLEAIEPLSEEECTAGEELLTSVITQAPILRKMPVQGFRDTFLRREGILSPRANHWLLQVKYETYDVVLERIPWPFQVVRLPWMKAPILVNWKLPDVLSD